MEDSITNIRLLDCNSKFSEEKLGGNNEGLSLYTNKVGHGIKVEAGDTVSLQSAFISELGAGDTSSIEITDEYLETRIVPYTKITYSNPINGCNEKILGFERATATTENFSLLNNANSTSIFYNFYKTANGENCFFQPRRFVYLDDTANKVNWSRDDSVLVGRPFHQSCPNPDDDNIGNIENVFVCDADYFRFQSPSAGQKTSDNIFKGITDNSRFTIFVQEQVYFGSQTDITVSPTTNTSPATRGWLELTEKLDISLNNGFQSPSAISDSLTNQFRKQGDLKDIEVKSLAYKDDSTDIQTFIPISTKLESPLYKTFYSANQNNNNASTYNDWKTWSGTSQEDGALNWLSSQQFIGVKRPELWLKGRAVAKQLQTVSGGTTIEKGFFNFIFDLKEEDFERGDPAAEHSLFTTIPWNASNLEVLRDLFIEQGQYPELFENKLNYYSGFTTTQNSRFLHMNTRKSGADQYATNQLGDDNLTVDDSINRISCPFFFDYDPSLATTLTDGIVQPAYGFARKITRTSGTHVGDFIYLTTQKLGFIEDLTLPSTLTTLPLRLFRRNACDTATDGTTIDKTTHAGFDIHFNAFGNLFLGLTTGWTNEMFNEAEITNAIPTLYKDANASTLINPEIKTANIISEIYLGADQPVCSFNTTTNRFEFAQLHTPEFVQNKYNAGGVKLNASGEDYIPLTPSQGQRVYKINKRLNSGNFTPDMTSYLVNESDAVKVFTEVGLGASALYDFENLNFNMKPWSCFDSLTGVVIKDFGYTESNWNSGIWGILGFTYQQFNTIRTSSNSIISRVSNSNKNALPYAFTNANVSPSSTISFITNVFGAGMYNLALPLTLSANTSLTTPPDVLTPAGYRKQIFPAITEEQTSIVLSAPNLPRKLQNGYFLIRSDILDESSYNGGFESSALYPVVGIVSKVDNTGDFFTSIDSSLQFTFTRPKVISSIRTSIHDPSQRLSKLNTGSSIIYKITKTRPHSYDIVSQIMKSK